jgi:hypothetical protein
MEGTAVCTIVQFGPTPLNDSSVELGVITKCSNSEGSSSWMRKSDVTIPTVWQTIYLLPKLC